jgi:hypothetical protein
MSDFFASQPKDKSSVLIGASELRQAERLIRACEECNPSAAKVPFDKILDFVTDSNPAITDYTLEPSAKCLNCKREISDKTLVEPR